ncbi:hypothetical protein ACPF8X_05780 [Streptomyces sp. G35A]
MATDRVTGWRPAAQQARRRSFLRRVGGKEQLDVTLAESELVVEVGVDVARDASGP